MSRRASIPAVFAFLAGSLAFAQTPFQVTGQIGAAAAVQIPESGSLAMTATGVGRDVIALIRATNTSASPVTVTRIGLSASADFSLASTLTLPATVPAASSLSFLVRFTPSSGFRSVANLSIEYTQGSTSSAFLFGMVGTAPEFAFSYFVMPGGALTPVFPGGRIAFPATNIGNSRNVLVVISNRGSAPGTIMSVASAGADFQLSGMPGSPQVVASGEEARVSIVFTARLSGPSLGLLTVNFADRSAAFDLEGTGTMPDLVVSYALADGSLQQTGSGGRIVFPATNPPDTAPVIISIVNRGIGAGTVTSVFLTGNGFQLPNPPVLPAALEAGRELRFVVLFSPSQTGTYSGSLHLTLGGYSMSIFLEGSTPPPKFTVYYVLSDGNARPLTEGGRLTFLPTPANTAAPADVVVANDGLGAGSILGITLTGTPFELSGVPVFPFQIKAGQSLRFRVLFSPRQTGSFNGALRIDLSNRSLAIAVEGSTSAPEFSLRYLEPGTNNVLPLQEGGALAFPATPVDTRTTITLVVINRGHGTGFVNSITLSSTDAGAFQLAEQPLLPAAVAAGEFLNFGVRFSPTRQSSYFATLRLELTDRTITLALQGTGTGPSFVYEILQADSQAAAVSPGTILTLPDTALGQTATLTLQVRNAGTADGQIAAIAVTGLSFQLLDAPLVPLTLKPEQSQRIRINFAPAQPGNFAGRLRIGGDAFELAGKGIGPRLVYSFTNSASTSAVAESGSVVLTPTQVGRNSRVEFSIRNTGTSATAISNISLLAPSAVYQLVDLPALPRNLGPDEEFAFGIVFTPNNTGTLTATLRVNTAAFTLSGAGAQPLALASYRYEGASGAQEPLLQPAIGLTLAAPYPLPLQGALELSFVSDVLGNNPAVQFATGGRKAAFTIPPNTTRALFEANANTVRVQTGTVAGDILLTPSFGTEAGLDLTPSSPPVLTLSIARAAPKLIEARITARARDSITLAVIGYSTTRSLRQMDIRLAARPGKELSNTQLIANLEGPSLLWFQSAESQGFGGLFTVSVPIVLQGGKDQEDLAGRLQSAEISVRNEVGASNAVTVAVQ